VNLRIQLRSQCLILLLRVQTGLTWHQPLLVAVIGLECWRQLLMTREMSTSLFVQEEQNECATKRLRQSSNQVCSLSNKHVNVSAQNKTTQLNGDPGKSTKRNAIMVQEHWLTPDNLYKLNQISDDYFVFGSSAMTNIVRSGPLFGRPFGVTAILVNKKHITTVVNLISCDRYTAIKVANWLLITVYMPCVGTIQRDLLYIDILHQLQILLDTHPNCSWLIGGDFNTNLDSGVDVSSAVNQFMSCNQLSRCDVLFPAADNFTFFNESTQSGTTQ